MSKILVSIGEKYQGLEKVKSWGSKGWFKRMFVVECYVTVIIRNPISHPQNERQRKGKRQETIWPRSAARASSQIYPLGNHQREWGKEWWWDTGTGMGRLEWGLSRARRGCKCRDLLCVCSPSDEVLLRLLKWWEASRKRAYFSSVTINQLGCPQEL